MRVYSPKEVISEFLVSFIQTTAGWFVAPLKPLPKFLGDMLIVNNQEYTLTITLINPINLASRLWWFSAKVRVSSNTELDWWLDPSLSKGDMYASQYAYSVLNAARKRRQQVMA